MTLINLTFLERKLLIFKNLTHLIFEKFLILFFYIFELCMILSK